jgi:tripartite-type tricarboxylate transporter receptor subunit TctC
VPTVAEAGLPGYEATTWSAIYAPRGTPPDLVRRISDAVAVALSRNDVASRFAEIGVTTRPSTPEQLARMARADRAKWARELDDARRGRGRTGGCCAPCRRRAPHRPGARYLRFFG